MSQAAWSFVDYGCGHSIPVRGGDRTIPGACLDCASVPTTEEGTQMIIATAGRTIYALGALDGGLYAAVQTYDDGSTAIVSMSTQRALLDTIHFNTTERGTGLERAIQFAQDAIL